MQQVRAFAASSIASFSYRSSVEQEISMYGSNRLLLTLYLVVVSLILIIIMLSASGAGE